MPPKVKNAPTVADEQSTRAEEEELSSEKIWRRGATTPTATGPRMTQTLPFRMTQSLPNSPRLVSSAEPAASDTTSANDTECKETGYDTPDELLDDFQSEFGRSWSDMHSAPGEPPSQPCSHSPEATLSYSVAGPCVLQGWVISNTLQLQVDGFGNGPYAYYCLSAPQEAEKTTNWGSEVTVMMRNIPKKLTQDALLHEVNSKGFSGTYDFVYLPMDQGSRGNRGYAFLNFTDPAYAAAFKSCYEGRQLNQYSSRKFIAILPADLQGLEANRAHFSTLRASQEDSGPRALFLRQPPTAPAKSSEVSEQCRGVRAEGAAAKPAASALKPRPGADSRIHTKSCAASASADRSQTPPVKNKPVINFCPYCGGSAGEGFKFCQYCGKSLCL
jgi:hypothetical protein